MNENCIEILNLNYKNIFEKFSIGFEKNKFITISGPNNCGKTTLIRILENKIDIKDTILVYGKKIEEYNMLELNNIIKAVIPTEINFMTSTIEEELNYALPEEFSKNIRQKRIREIAKEFKFTKISTTTVDKLSEEEKIKLQLAIALINNPRILLVDNLSPHFSKEKFNNILDIFKNLVEKEKMTIIMVTNDLEATLKSDYLYVISDSKIIIEGIPYEVLQKDNVLNKVGLNLPFMMDLSVKLRDYDLIKNVELDMDRMVGTLWK